MLVADIKYLTDRVINRARGILPDITRERIKEDILKSPLVVNSNRVVGYVQQGHIAVFFSVPFATDEPIRTSAFDVGEGITKVNDCFEFTDGCGIKIRILPDANYEILD